MVHEKQSLQNAELGKSRWNDNAILGGFGNQDRNRIGNGHYDLIFESLPTFPTKRPEWSTLKRKEGNLPKDLSILVIYASKSRPI